MMMLSRISFSFGRRMSDVTAIQSFDAVMPRLGNASPQLVWGSDETNGVPLGHWARG